MATQIKKYNKKVVTCDGCVYDGTNQQDIITFTGGKAKVVDGVFVLEYEGGNTSPINVTDWVYKDMYGRFWTCTHSHWQIEWVIAPAQE